jgi:integrase/recombinase XerC
LAPNTIDKRVRNLRLYAREAGLAASREEIEDWLDERHLSAKSRSLWLSSLHTFYAWAIDAGHLTEDPTAKIRSPKLRRALPRPIPDEQLAKALANATPLHRLWLLLGAYEGLRCCEIAGLAREDVLASEGLLRVVEAKGGNERMVPLHGEVLEALELLPMPASGPLFMNRFRTRVTPGHVSHELGDYLHSLGIASTPHALRHWFGSSMLRATHDIRVVQEAMGHKSIMSTSVYTAFDQGACRSAVAGLQVS